MRLALVLLVLILAGPSAHGADANICRPYAAQSSELLMRWAWLRFYTGCLGVEGPDPVVPKDALAAFAMIDPVNTPVWPLDRNDVAAIQSIGIVPASGPVDATPVPPLRPGIAADAVADAPEAPDAVRVAKCRRLFPASFDLKSMTGIPFGKHHRRTPCP